MEDVRTHVDNWLDVMQKNERMHEDHWKMAAFTAATIARLTAEVEHSKNLMRHKDQSHEGEIATLERLYREAKAERDAAVRDLDAYQVAAAIVKVKCEECWNLTGMVDAEMHAILEFIHRSLQNAARPSSEVWGG